MCNCHFAGNNVYFPKLRQLSNPFADIKKPEQNVAKLRLTRKKGHMDIGAHQTIPAESILLESS
ncbi:hypothetical protein KL86DES1_10548 [uncultured Desulfovibrio sp.]|uniref:Uncharacterized protein n=1 Tax=uncultured Desulfovibrio sp. TaxID=167968 RepID=A0A212KZJ7_9BACT|nr:hypothetical protein KL86DES1_10548 [uncultured Desulfovibrio sp.]VZH32423.1 conserved protein of unknown function [Desulfovibrio sp. 86]